MPRRTQHAKKSPTSWWSTLPGILTAIAAVVGAVATLVTALKAAGVFDVQRPQSPLVTLVQPDVLEVSESVSRSVGWIYVGTRVNGEWQTTSAEGREPAKTLTLDGYPTKGTIYEISSPVNLRKDLPATNDRDIPPVMTASIGVLVPGNRVKIDQVAEIRLEKPTRTWVWAHVTAGP